MLVFQFVQSVFFNARRTLPRPGGKGGGAKRLLLQHESLEAAKGRLDQGFLLVLVQVRIAHRR